jgi:hypothetical protein
VAGAVGGVIAPPVGFGATAPVVDQDMDATTPPPLSDTVPLRATCVVGLFVLKGLVAGDVIASVGGVWSRVTIRVEVGPTFPAPSVALKVIVLAPTTSGTEADHEAVPVAMPLAPPPSARDQVTLATPEPPESDAVPVTVTGVVFRMFGLVGLTIVGASGAVPSQITVIVAVEMFPAVSCAVTLMTWEPATRAMLPEFQVLPAIEAPPLVLLAGFDQLTLATLPPPLSDTVPLRVTVFDPTFVL